MLKEKNQYEKSKVISVHENVVTLLFIIPAEKNLEQLKMMTEDNEQEQRWQHKVTDKTTKGQS